MPVGRPTKYNAEMCDKLIECGKQGMTLVEAAAEMDLAMSTLYLWRDKHEAFSEAFKRAEALAEAFWAKRLREGLALPASEFNGAANLKYMAQRWHSWSEKNHHHHSGGLEVKSITRKIID